MSFDYVVVDIETTGFSHSKDHITEIAAVKVVDGVVVSEFQSLVNPGIPIPESITVLTGINDAMVVDQPNINVVLPRFLSFVGDLPIVAHNACFDYGFLTHNAKKCGVRITNNTLCTKRLADNLLPNLPSKKLSSVCKHFGLINKQAHRAMTDVKVTNDIFVLFLKKLATRNIVSKSQVISFEHSL